MHLVIVLHPGLEADAKDGDRWDLGSTKVANLPRLAHPSRHVTGKECSLVRLEHLPHHIGDAFGIPNDPLRHPEWIGIGIVHDGELDIGILGGCLGQITAQEEPGGNHQVVLLAGELCQVGLVLRRLIGLDERGLNSQILLSALDACPLRSVKALVIDASCVGHKPDTEALLFFGLASGDKRDKQKQTGSKHQNLAHFVPPLETVSVRSCTEHEIKPGR